MSLPTTRELLAQMHAGQLGFTEATEQHLQRIARHNASVNAVVTLNREQALRQARELDRARNLQPLAGLPITVKDAFATVGLRTTASHPPLAGYVPAHDATLVARLRQAGAVLLGKTNLPQLAGYPHCNSPLFGPTRNPWNPALTSGGSSGGSAAAVAMGFSCLDLGSDIGGSLRIPAAFCGVAALKATENRLPRTGHIPHLPNGRRSVRHCLSFGLLARDVDSLQLGFEQLLGPDEQDVEVPALTAMQPTHKKGNLRIAWWDEFDGLPLCQRTRAAMQRSVTVLQEQGFTVGRCKPPGFDFDMAWRAYGVIAGGEIGLGMPATERWLLSMAGRFLPRAQRLGRYFTQGLRTSLTQYNQALNLREQLIHELEGFLNQWDVWICPVAPTVAYPHTVKPWSALAVDQQRLPYLEATVSMTTPFSLTGSPVVTLPAGVEQGLPVGLQVIGKRWQDELLLAVCRQIAPFLGEYREPPLLSGSVASREQVEEQ